MKWTAAVALLAVMAAGGNSCTSGTSEPSGPQPVYQDPNNNDYSEKHILLSDGRTVVCLEWMSGSSSSNVRGGISCDWEHAEGAK